MRRLKIPLSVLFAAVFLFAAAASGFAQGRPESQFDFEASVESLASAAQSGKTLPIGRYVVLTGTLRSVETNPDESFSARLELAAGQWLGTSRVVLQTVFVNLSGESYRAFFDQATPSYIRLGSSVLVVARVAGVSAGENGEPVVSLDGVHLRRLDS